MWEYLSLYAERNNSQENYQVKHSPDRGNRIEEQQLLNDLSNSGWELVTLVEAYTVDRGRHHHQLYLKRQRR